MLDGERSGTSGAGGPAQELREAVQRLGRALLVHPPGQPDRAVAEDALAALAREAEAEAAGRPLSPADRAAGVDGTDGVHGVDAERMHHLLLLVAAAVGSISALAEPLERLRRAVERLAPPRVLDPLPGPASR